MVASVRQYCSLLSHPAEECSISSPRPSIIYSKSSTEGSDPFSDGRHIVHDIDIEDIVVLVYRPANLARSPRFARPDGIAFWHDVKAVYDIVYAVYKINGSLGKKGSATVNFR